MQQAAQFRQQQQQAEHSSVWQNSKASREAGLMERRQRAGRRVYSQIQQAEQGQPLSLSLCR